MDGISTKAIEVEASRLLEYDQLTARIIDLTKDYPPIEYLFERNGQYCFSKGDIEVIKGKAKAGKSTFIVTLVSAIIMGENMGFKAINKEITSMYIDTEQNPINTVKLTKKIMSTCDLPLTENNQKFIALNLRGDNPVDRKRFIKEAIEKFKPGFIIIDGVKDLIEGGDINSPKEASETVQFLMTLTKEYDTSILAVLHENKNDEHLRGHIGSELLNKCSELWQVKKTDDLHEVEQTENRNAASKRIKYGFRFDQNDLPFLVDVGPSQSRQEINFQKKVESLYQCFQRHIQLIYTDLLQEYSEIHGCAIKTAQTHISEFNKSGHLIKDDSKLYRFNKAKMPPINQSN